MTARPDFQSLRLKPPIPEAVRLSPVRRDGNETESRSRTHYEADGKQFHASTAGIAAKLAAQRCVRAIVAPPMVSRTGHETNRRRPEK